MTLLALTLFTLRKAYALFLLLLVLPFTAHGQLQVIKATPLFASEPIYYGSSTDILQLKLCVFWSSQEYSPPYTTRTYIPSGSARCEWLNGIVSYGSYYQKIRFKSLTCPAASQGNYEYDAITDSGCGCSNQAYKSLFVDFDQADGDQGCSPTDLPNKDSGCAGEKALETPVTWPTVINISRKQISVVLCLSYEITTAIIYQI